MEPKARNKQCRPCHHLSFGTQVNIGGGGGGGLGCIYL
jgi:hypothetical protein